MTSSFAVGLQGVTASSFGATEKAAFVEGTAASAGIPAANIKVKSVTDNRRRLAAVEVYSTTTEFEDAVSGVSINFDVSSVLSGTSTPASLYAAVSATISTAVSSGALSTSIVAQSTKMGATGLSTATVNKDSFVAQGFVQIVYTKAPTTAPTSSPAASPIASPTSSQSVLSSYLPLFVGLGGVLLIGVGLITWYLRRRRLRKTYPEKQEDDNSYRNNKPSEIRTKDVSNKVHPAPGDQLPTPTVRSKAPEELLARGDSFQLRSMEEKLENSGPRTMDSKNMDQYKYSFNTKNFMFNDSDDDTVKEDDKSQGHRGEAKRGGEDVVRQYSGSKVDKDDGKEEVVRRVRTDDMEDL